MTKHVLALLDDRLEVLETNITRLKRKLRNTPWAVEVVPLLPTTAEVAAWVVANDVRVLVVDQRLGDQPGTSGTVSYFGHDVVKAVRARLPALPIYLLTAFAKSDPNIPKTFGQMEAVFDRVHFAENLQQYIEIMVRAGMAFHTRNLEILGRLDALSRKHATGTLTDPERAELTGIQAQLNLENPDTYVTAVTAYEQSVNTLHELRQRIDAHLRTIR